MDVHIVEIKKTVDEKQIAMAEVYVPDVPDAHGDFMTALEIEKMAYDFMRNKRLDMVDVEHDNQDYGCYIVESFIARKSDDTFVEGAWVVGIHIPDEGLWDRVKSGELNGFSMEALAIRKESDVEMVCPVMLNGQTDKAEDGHFHHYAVFIDEDGNFAGGSTSVVNGHKHDILTGTVTEEQEEHAHKYNVVQAILELGDEGEEESQSE